MEFDSPDAAKEFPGLYLSDVGKAGDSLEYSEDGDKKKKKEKKDKKDKGYSALAAESSQDEDDVLDPKSPGKGKKIKAFSKLSGKKKDKDKKSEKSEKELKKAEKEAKEKRKSEERERKSLEKELNTTPGPSAPRPQIPFSGMRANSLQPSSGLTPQSSIDLGTPTKRSTISSGDGSVKETTPSKSLKEKSAAFNVFLNAPAPLLSKLKDKDSSKEKEGKKDKEHKEKSKKHKDKDKDKEKSDKPKKDREHKEKEKKEHASGMAKVKLKLMRSKNSLEDVGDAPHVVSHQQFPEDPEALAKEIKKYEGLLEQAHTHLKSSKKISKRQEEQLWELQRTLTQLKRKLRSINALSSATAYHIHNHPLASERSVDRPVDRALHDLTVSPQPAHPIFKKCDSFNGNRKRLERSNATIEDDVVPVPVSSPEIPKIPMPPSRNNKAEQYTVSPPPVASKSPPQAESVNTETKPNETRISRESSGKLTPIGNEDISTVALEETNAAATNCNDISSPRPSIDVIAQVHRPSIPTDVSDDDDGDVTEIAQEDIILPDDEYPSRRASMSNDSHDSKENIEAVLDDANKMIGSMHEELMFNGQVDLPDGSRIRSDENLDEAGNRVITQDDSDVEFFTNDLEIDPDLVQNEVCPDPFSMPVFDAAEFLAIENEALTMFTLQLQEDLQKEQSELDELIQKNPKKCVNSDGDSSDGGKNSHDDDSFSDLMTMWTQLRSENENLWDNVNRLRLAVAACKVEEFRLQTRLKYIEAKNSALSPVTTTTPLQTEG